jgi:integrase
MIDVVQDIGRAIDVYIGELARRRKSPRTRDTYRRHLNAFADTLPPYTAVSEITPDDCRRFLDRWADAEPSTMATGVSTLRGFFRFLIDDGHVPEPGPMAKIQRPRRKRPEDLDVVTITETEGQALIGACETWQELLCITVALYTGRRRAALNAARRSDVDLKARTIRFRDKGDKLLIQRIPAELATVIEQADADHVWQARGDYLIPSRRPSTVTRKLRKDSLIWDTVKIVARRAGVDSHVHALRAAFAVKFDEQHPDRIDTLRSLLGHDRMESTLIYLRRKDRRRDQEVVDDLSWAPSGSNRDGLETDLSPANARVRPIRDSNPCSDDPERPSGVDGGAIGSRPSLLDAKLAELSARARAVRKARR